MTLNAASTIVFPAAGIETFGSESEGVDVRRCDSWFTQKVTATTMATIIPMIKVTSRYVIPLFTMTTFANVVPSCENRFFK